MMNQDLFGATVCVSLNIEDTLMENLPILGKNLGKKFLEEAYIGLYMFSPYRGIFRKNLMGNS